MIVVMKLMTNGRSIQSGSARSPKRTKRIKGV